MAVGLGGAVMRDLVEMLLGELGVKYRERTVNGDICCGVCDEGLG